MNMTFANTSARPVAAILIHGAWQGGWVWDDCLTYLEEGGLAALAPDMPGCGADKTPHADITKDSFVDKVCALADRLRGRVALVGHSGGGIIATAAAQRLGRRVSHLIYVAGMALPSGETFPEIEAKVAGPDGELGISPYIRVTPDGVSTEIPTGAAKEFLFSGLDDATASEAATHLRPQPMAGHMFRTWTDHGFDDVPKLYIEAINDRSIPLAAQRLMQDGLENLTVVGIESGHAVPLSHPRELAREVLHFLDYDTIHSTSSGIVGA